MLKLLLLLASIASAQAPTERERSFVFPEFRNCGLVTRYSSAKIDPACLQSANNVLLDEDFSVFRRNGYAKYNNTACQDAQAVKGLWAFDATDGTHYIVIFSSRSFFQTKGSGDCTAISGLNSFSASAEFECVQTLGRLWCTNGVDTPFSWDGSSTQTISGAPVGKHIGAFRNRVWIADISGSRTRLRGSGELDGTDWTVFTPGKSTTSVNIDIAGTNDGTPINCLMGEYQNAFYIGRNYDLYALYGYDRRDFTLRRISKEVGCIEPKSVQEKNNALYWLSRRGEERLSGTTIDRVSDPIRPVIDSIIQASGNTTIKTFSSQSDFQGGNSKKCVSGSKACLSTTISPGNIVPTSYTIVDSQPSDFAAWTSSSNISTNVVSGYVTLAVATMAFTGTDNPSGWTFVTGTSQWTVNPNAGCGTTYSPTNVLRTDFLSNAVGTSCGATGETAGYKIEVYFGNSVAASTTASSANNDIFSVGCTTHSLAIPSTWWVLNQGTGASVKLTMTGGVSGVRNYDSSPESVASPVTAPAGGTIEYARYCTNIYANTCQCDIALNPTNQYFPSGNFTSRLFDTAFSTPIWGNLVTTISSNSAQTITFQTKSSADGSSFGSLVSATPGSQVSSANNEYLEYKASFVTPSSSSQTATMSGASIAAETTGYYISDCAAPDTTKITSWGNFRVNSNPDNGAFSYWVSTGPNCGFATTSTGTWTQQIPNAPINIATSAYIATRILFSLNHATQTPTINDFSFEWNEGTSRPPVTSAVYRDRYFLFYTSSTAPGAVNDHAVVADASDKWTLFDGINAYSAVNYQGRLYTGDANNTGFVYLQDSGQDDNGSNYTTLIKTADIDFGNAAQKKILKRTYIYLQPPSDATQSINPVFKYYIDGSTTPYSFGSVSLNESIEGSGYFVAKLPVSDTTAPTFHWINLEITYTGNIGPLRIYGINIIYEPIEWE